MRRSAHAVGAALLALILPGLAAAQIPPEIPLVPRLGTGARALGMGGAYVAVGDDYTALTWNPAALAQLRRIEFAGAFDIRSVDTEVTYLGHRERTPLDGSHIHSLGFAYPFPTYRGSLVIGFSYDRLTPLDSSYYRSGSGGPIASETEEILEDGGVGAYQAGFAADVSPRLSLGVTGRILSGSSRRDRSFEYWEEGEFNAVNREFTYTTTDMDITAFSGALGALLRFGSQGRLGFALHFPETYTLSGRSEEDVRRYQVDPPPPDTLDYYDFYNFEDKITLPYRVAGGISYVIEAGAGSLLLSGDLTYVDWQQIDYEGPIRGKNRDYAYRSTTDIRLGAEYTFDQAPLRLRAGFISQPLAYRMIATDVYFGDYETADITQDRRYGTVGAGILVDRSLTLDIAYVFGGYERQGSSILGPTVEKVDESRIILGAAFRL